MALQGAPDPSEMNIARFHIERGAAVMGTDNQIGTVEQIVIDRESGELRALIVRSPDELAEFELSARHILSSTGEHVYVDVGRGDIAMHPELVTAYDPAQYIPVYQGQEASEGAASRVALSSGHAVVTGVEDNAADLVAPESLAAPTHAAGVSQMQPDATPAPSATDTAVSNASRATSAPTPSTPPAASDTATIAPAGSAPAENATEPSAPATASEPEKPSGQTEPTEPTEPRVPLVEPETRDPERPMPSQQPSPTPNTTGPLVGEKPSSSGMGENSSVPVAHPEDSATRSPESSASASAAAMPATSGASATLLAEAEAAAANTPAWPAVEPLLHTASDVPVMTPTPTPDMPSSPIPATPPPAPSAPTRIESLPLTTTTGRRSPDAVSSQEGPSLLWLARNLQPTWYFAAVGLVGGLIISLMLSGRRRRAENAER